MKFQGYDNSFSLAGKTALITGGGAGIGRAIASLFYQKGANVVLVDLNPDIEKIGHKIAPDPQRLHTITADITQKDERDKAVRSSLEKFGTINVLVNNAGIVRLAPALVISETDWDLTLDINLRTAFFLSQQVGAQMIKQGGGKIISLASQAGVVALDRHVAYCASKAAIISMTKVLALEWGPQNIQVNAISPTVVLTELGKKAWAGEVGEAMKRKIPARRFAYPEEVAACALFLASDAAAMINGENLVIDGGYTIQ